MCYKERKRRLEVVGCNVEALGSLLKVCIVEQLNPKSEKNVTSFLFTNWLSYHARTRSDPLSLVVVQSLNSSSVVQSCLTLCDLMDCNMPDFPIHNQLPEFTRTHVHRVCDAIQQSHPLLSPSPPAFNLFQNQGLFQWFIQFFTSIGQNIGVSVSAPDLPMNIQGWFPSRLTCLISFLPKGLSRVLIHTQVLNSYHQYTGWFPKETANLF